MDPRANGQIQRDWGLLIALYLFLGGVGSGAYVIGAANSLMGSSYGVATEVALWISWPAVLVGTFALIADLGQPLKAILAGVKVGSSWIARGFWVISIFMFLAFLHQVLVEYAGMAADAPVVVVISVVATASAVGTMAYTGLLLGAAKGVPFWRSGIVPVVFVVSAMVTGHFTVMIGMAFVGATAATIVELHTMALEAAALVGLELLAIFFLLQAAHRSLDARESAQRVMRRLAFVLGYFVFGLAAPLVIMVFLFATEGLSNDLFIALSVAGAALGLAGGLILRHSLLVVGTLPTWNMAGFEFRRIARPKEPKPEIGLLPPQ
jgi:formate-dependent nitrite reductase membrane component NrfD